MPPTPALLASAAYIQRSAWSHRIVTQLRRGALMGLRWAVTQVIRAAASSGSLRCLVPIGKEVMQAIGEARMHDAIAARSDPAAVPPDAAPFVHQTFPAPNAWITGGYGPFLQQLSTLCAELAPDAQRL
jgi:hypothetical protein